jgi:chromodomain-helicase-DNA-binding protein 4
MYVQVMYVGSSQARATLREYEFFYPRKSSKKRDKGKRKIGESKQDRVKFDVLLTSYEMINLDTAILKALKWECLVPPSSPSKCFSSSGI